MEHPAFDGRAYAIAAGPRRLLEAAGLWAKLPQPTGPILDIRVTDGRLGRPASRLHLHFDTRELGEGAGPFGWMVEARSLRVAMNAHMAALPALQRFRPGRGAGGTPARRCHGPCGRRPGPRLPAGDRRGGATLRRCARRPASR